MGLKLHWTFKQSQTAAFLDQFGHLLILPRARKCDNSHQT